MVTTGVNTDPPRPALGAISDNVLVTAASQILQSNKSIMLDARYLAGL